MTLRFALAATASLLLAACGSAEDASNEAQADSVEMPADAAMTGIEEAPVADPGANAVLPTDSTAADTTVTPTEADQIQEAGDNAADTAEAAADALAEEGQ